MELRIRRKKKRGGGEKRCTPNHGSTALKKSAKIGMRREKDAFQKKTIGLKTNGNEQSIKGEGHETGCPKKKQSESK